jgi:hypothetical protein
VTKVATIHYFNYSALPADVTKSLRSTATANRSVLGRAIVDVGNRLTLGVMHSASLAVCTIGQGLAAARSSRGEGPPYQLYGRIPIYTWGIGLKWAKARLSPPRHSTTEGDLPTRRQEMACATLEVAPVMMSGRAQTKPPNKK